MQEPLSLVIFSHDTSTCIIFQAKSSQKFRPIKSFFATQKNKKIQSFLKALNNKTMFVSIQKFFYHTILYLFPLRVFISS